MTNEVNHTIAAPACAACSALLPSSFVDRILAASLSASRAMTFDQFAEWLSRHCDASDGLGSPRLS